MGIRGFQRALLLAIVMFAGYLPVSNANATIEVQGQWETALPDRGRSEFQLTVGPDGSAYMLTEGRNQIVKYAADGAIGGRWRIQGEQPSAITVDSDGTVIVAVDGKLERYTGGGQRLKPWRYNFPKKAGQPDEVSAIKSGPDGSIYVLD
ncbi:MAG: hypothetical protein WBW44_02930, partial [Solirubrobacterales bacterium]